MGEGVDLMSYARAEELIALQFRGDEPTRWLKVVNDELWYSDQGSGLDFRKLIELVENLPLALPLGKLLGFAENGVVTGLYMQTEPASELCDGVFYHYCGVRCLVIEDRRPALLTLGDRTLEEFLDGLWEAFDDGSLTDIRPRLQNQPGPVTFSFTGGQSRLNFAEVDDLTPRLAPSYIEWAPINSSATVYSGADMENLPESLPADEWLADEAN
jgi:hypothetical protein